MNINTLINIALVITFIPVIAIGLFILVLVFLPSVSLSTAHALGDWLWQGS